MWATNQNPIINNCKVWAGIRTLLGNFNKSVKDFSDYFLSLCFMVKSVLRTKYIKGNPSTGEAASCEFSGFVHSQEFPSTSGNVVRPGNQLVCLFLT